jgi:type II secretory pathway predicted ATPase ExeA
MYESYFKLREKPFDIVPNPAYLYLSKTHKQAMTYFNFGLQERFGFVLMTGEVGSGKTTLIRELIRTMGPEINLARVFNTRVSSQELIAMINEDFGLDTAGKGKVLMLKDLYEHLIKEYEQGRRSVVIIDEAQNLSLDLLEEVRMLSPSDHARRSAAAGPDIVPRRDAAVPSADKHRVPYPSPDAAGDRGLYSAPPRRCRQS